MAKYAFWHNFDLKTGNSSDWKSSAIHYSSCWFHWPSPCVWRQLPQLRLLLIRKLKNTMLRRRWMKKVRQS